MSTTCPICQSSDLEDTGKVRLPADRSMLLMRFAEHHVLRCRHCGLLSAVPRIVYTPQDYAQMYDRKYFHWDNRHWLRRERREVAHRIRTMLKHRPAARTFVDVGCGPGAAIAVAHELGLQPAGIDVTDTRRPGLPEHAFHHGEIGDVIDRDGLQEKFDLVYLNQVFEHVNDPMAYLALIHRLVKPDGLVFIGVPNEGGVRNRFLGGLRRWMLPKDISHRITPLRPPYHPWGHTRRSLSLGLNNAGFAVLEIQMLYGVFDFLRNRPTRKSFYVDLAMMPASIAGWLAGNGYVMESYSRRAAAAD